MGRPPKHPNERLSKNRTFRVRGGLDEKLQGAAEKAGRSVSEEIENRLDRSFEYDEAFGDAKKLLADAQQVMSKSLDAHLRQSGYTPVTTPKGKVWLSPGMPPEEVSVFTTPDGPLLHLEKAIENVVERSVRRAMRPTHQPAPPPPRAPTIRSPSSDARMLEEIQAAVEALANIQRSMKTES